MSKIADIAGKIAAPIVEQLGYELVDVEYVCEHTDWYLNFYIDKPGGIMFEDCERVSTAIDPILEENDPTNGKSYILCVSSPGLDRPIKTEKDFARNMGKTVEVKLYKPIDGKKQFVGDIAAYTGESLELDSVAGKITLDMKDVALVRLHIEF